ncbi:unnamed protein product [Spirodela intermedia]|uniref:Uncharacterized protein n=1 Tax=Spirodela intermedia TaxID=51605 RepID=A0A7I8J7A2_SPIIN|nr:unnamed protein product [Spirodela intermedia]CAA6665910.1 unnamed protein product [Spirodela intermedia]
MDYDYRNRTGPVNRPAPASSFYPEFLRSQGSKFLYPLAEQRIPILLRLRSPQLAPQVTEVPRSHFSFDFDFERRILAEAEKGSQNWSRIVPENQPNFSASASSAVQCPSWRSGCREVCGNGLGREAATLAVANFGDDAIKVREFVKGYNLLREMGFASKNVAEALAMYDNDTDQALAHFLNSSS